MILQPVIKVYIQQKMIIDKKGISLANQTSISLNLVTFPLVSWVGCGA